MEEFARATDFDAFYQQQKMFYQQEMETYREEVPVKAIWQFLEKHFPARIDSYHIVLSPLMVGTNNTMKFVDRDDGFTESVLFVPSPNVMDPHPSFPPALASEVMTRSVFTEIDHNYVNPETDKYLEEIDRAMRRRTDWHTGRGYPSAALKFNEYFTWAVFFVWAEDHYPTRVYMEIYDLTLEHMEARGFVRFESFAKALLDRHHHSPETPLSDLMPAMIDWMADQ